MRSNGSLAFMATAREIAVQRNARSVDGMLKRLHEFMKQESIEEPMKGFPELVTRAKANLVKLDAAMEEAEMALRKIDDKHDAGHLDRATYEAETSGARTVIRTGAFLSSLFLVAEKADNTYPLKCLVIATEVLLSGVDSNLLRETRYPRNEFDLRRKLIEAKLAHAQDIQASVLKALDGTHERLGLTFLSTIESG